MSLGTSLMPPLMVPYSEAPLEPTKPPPKLRPCRRGGLPQRLRHNGINPTRGEGRWSSNPSGPPLAGRGRAAGEQPRVVEGPRNSRREVRNRTSTMNCTPTAPRRSEESHSEVAQRWVQIRLEEQLAPSCRSVDMRRQSALHSNFREISAKKIANCAKLTDIWRLCHYAATFYLPAQHEGAFTQRSAVWRYVVFLVQLAV